MAKIQVKLNPDVPPTGSDLAVVNAARRSFNTRSEWDTLSHSEMTHRLDKEILSDWTWVPGGNSGYYYKLKDKDKRLIEFLARGMTADDFEAFVHQVPAPDTEEHKEELVDKLWQWRNTPTHDTPFNHCFISFEIKAPIFCRAQLVKHEYLIMSEFSRRYITDGIEFYEPDYWRKAAPNKKQGSLEEKMDLEEISSNKGPWTLSYELQNNQVETSQLYKELVLEGVAPEQARMVLPQSTMTEWTWSGTLGAFAKMCQLRLHPEAQYEARLVAQEVYKHLQDYYPVGAKALVEGVTE